MKNQRCVVDLELKNEGRYVLVDSQFSDAEKQDYADHPPIKRTLGEGQTGTNEWRQFKLIYTVPKTDGSIRLDLGISHPGVLWIDDVRIEKVDSP